MRTLVFGADGQLGKDLVDVFRRAGGVTGTTIDDVDISDSAAVLNTVRGVEPDLAINSAAYTNVEKAEDDSVAAYRVNETGARNIAEAAAERNAPVVFIGTDFVFDGKARRPYEPGDPIAPRGVYAESKAAGETATRAGNPQWLVVRTAWLYGPGGDNFVEKILRAAASRPSLRVVNDEIGSPTYTRDLAEAIYALCVSGARGTFHAVNAGMCSRYDFAQAIVNGAGLATPIEPCAAAEYPSKAPRPSYSVLSNVALEAACGFRMPAWQDALARYLKRRETIS